MADPRSWLIAFLVAFATLFGGLMWMLYSMVNNMQNMYWDLQHRLSEIEGTLKFVEPYLRELATRTTTQTITITRTSTLPWIPPPLLGFTEMLALSGAVLGILLSMLTISLYRARRTELKEIDAKPSETAKPVETSPIPVPSGQDLAKAFKKVVETFKEKEE